MPKTETVFITRDMNHGKNKQQQQQSAKGQAPGQTHTQTLNEVTAVIIKDEPDPSSYAQMTLNSFWPSVMSEVRRIKAVDAKNQQLPLARIKKIMKLDEDVKMISAEAPLLFAKAAEIFIHELTLMAWVFTEENKRRTLQRSDIAMALSKYDQFDFLIDIVPREEVRPTKKESTTPSSSTGGASKSDEDVAAVGQATGEPNKPDSSAQIQYYLQLAQQQRHAMTQQSSGGATIVQPVGALAEGLQSGSTAVAQTAPTSNTVQGSNSSVSGGGGGAMGLPAGSIITAGGQTIPITTLLAQPNHALMGQIQLQGQVQQQQPQTQQIIQLSNGQHILVGGAPQQQQQILTAGGQVIGSVPQQPQFHILQQIMSPTGEIQQIQIPVTTNNMNLLRMTGGASVQQPHQILIQSPQAQQQQQGQLVATTANGGTVFLNAATNQIVGTTSAGGGVVGSGGTATLAQVKPEKGAS